MKQTIENKRINIPQYSILPARYDLHVFDFAAEGNITRPHLRQIRVYEGKLYRSSIFQIVIIILCSKFCSGLRQVQANTGSYTELMNETKLAMKSNS